jgi:hypothetical protein
MILVFLTALVLAAIDQVSRMEPLDIESMKKGSILFVPFFIMVVLKIGLIVAMRMKRAAPGDSTDPGPGNGPPP